MNENEVILEFLRELFDLPKNITRLNLSLKMDSSPIVELEFIPEEKKEKEDEK